MTKESPELTGYIRVVKRTKGWFMSNKWTYEQVKILGSNTQFKPSGAVGIYYLVEKEDGMRIEISSELLFTTL